MITMLSARATAYLRSCERRPAITDRGQIVAALQRARLPVFEPVVLFQQNYGGLTFHAGLAPLTYGILRQQRRGRPEAYTVYGEQEDGRWYFECVDTLYQMSFHLDEMGTYYEEWSPVASSFDTFIEGKALLAQMQFDGRWSAIAIGPAGSLDTRELLSRPDLVTVAEASDQYTTWRRSETLCLRIRGESLAAWIRDVPGGRAGI